MAALVLNPNTGNPVTAAGALAAWLQQNEPDLFAALAQRAGAHLTTGFGDWSDILSGVGSVASDIGSGITSAAEDVGNYLTSSSGLSSLTSLASAYLQNQTAQSVTQLQIARAQQGLPPAPVATATTVAGQPVPIYTAATGVPAGAQPVQLANGQTAYALPSSSLAALSTSSWTQYLPEIGIGVAALALLLMFSSRGN